MEELDRKFKKCPRCKEWKIVSLFGYRKKLKQIKSWCKACEVDAGLIRYNRDRKKIIDKNRKTVIQTSKNGKRIWIGGLTKRDYPENKLCEICGNEPKKLSYHHWDDDNPSDGVWSCHACHAGCNFFEKKDLVDRYVNLKKEITDGHKERAVLH